MKLKLTNKNYNGTIVEIKNIIPLEGCDNIQHTNIFGNLVIISKDIKVGDVGIFFPVETKLSKEYLSENNLYRDSNKNKDNTKKGFFEDNGRIRCVKLRRFPSMGLFMPMSSLEYTGITDMNLGDSFNNIGEHHICEKYIVPVRGGSLSKKNKKGRKPKVSKVIDGQFHFHYDSEQLGRNMNMIDPNDIINITYKIHGTSFISSNIICKKKLSPIENLLKFIGVDINDTHYDNIYSSRRVIKNDDIGNPQHYYTEDIWGIVNEELKDYIPKGWTLYGEIYGYTSDGGYIQKDYDYGCESEEHAFCIYRITITNPDGIVYEMPMLDVIRWCKANGLNHPPLLYHGKAVDLDKSLSVDNHFRENFLDIVKDKFNDKDCFMCKNIVPEEGCVIRIDGKPGALKQKSLRFYEKETKDLDKGETNIEDKQ